MDTRNIVVKAWFVTAAVGLVLVIGLGLFYFIAPRERIDADPVGAAAADVLVAPTDTFGQDPFNGRLVLVNYDLRPADRALEGSVMNNGADPFVNVQVHFSLYDATGTSVGTTADTVNTVQPGDTWRFAITLPLDAPVARADFLGLTAFEREPAEVGASVPADYEVIPDSLVN